MIGYNRIGSNGRLGNQMFQYAALRGIAAHHNYNWVVPSPHGPHQTNYGLFDCFEMTGVVKIILIWFQKIFQLIKLALVHLMRHFLTVVPITATLKIIFKLKSISHILKMKLKEIFNLEQNT